MSYTPRLKEDYSNKIVNELKDKLQLDNIMQVPVLEKIVMFDEYFLIVRISNYLKERLID